MALLRAADPGGGRPPRKRGGPQSGELSACGVFGHGPQVGAVGLGGEDVVVAVGRRLGDDDPLAVR